MKRLIIGSLFFALLGFGALKFMFSGVEVKYKATLPWLVSTKSDGTTHILGVDIGDATFKELMFKLKLLAEPALFEAPNGDLTLEAYFGKKKFGIFEARLVVEMDAEKALLKKMLAYSLPLLVVGLAGMVNEVSDKVLLKYLLPYHSQQF